MFGYLFVVAVCVGAVMADHCSVEDIKDIQHDWSFVWGKASLNARIIFGQAVFKKLIQYDASAIEPLKGVNIDHPDSLEFQTHVLRVLNGVDNAINLFDEQGVLIAHLDHLAQQHKDRPGVAKEHFEAFAKAVIYTLKHTGNCPNEIAWKRCLSALGHRISSQLKK